MRIPKIWIFMIFVIVFVLVAMVACTPNVFSNSSGACTGDVTGFTMCVDKVYHNVCYYVRGVGGLSCLPIGN